MAITFQQLGTLFSTANASPYLTSADSSPAADRLLLVGVVNVVSSGTAPVPTSVTGHGLTFEQVADADATGYLTTGVLQLATFWLAATGSSPTTGRVSVAVGGAPQGCIITEIEIAGADLSGSLQDVIVQAVSQLRTGDTAFEMDILAAASHADNRPIAFVFQNGLSGGTWTCDADWTLGARGQFSTPQCSGASAWREDAFDQTVTFTGANGNSGRTFGFEIKASTGGEPPAAVIPRLLMLGVG